MSTGEHKVLVRRYYEEPWNCLAMQRGRPTTFHNPTRHAPRYAVVSLSEPEVKH